MARRIARRRTTHADVRRTPSHAASPNRGSAPAGLTRLQQSAGNAAMLRLLRSTEIDRPVQRQSQRGPDDAAGEPSTGPGSDLPWVIRSPGGAVLKRVVPRKKERDGFWETIRKLLKRRKCKFWLCETVKVCKPPDKDEDWWKWWKWKCIDVEVCWCYLYEPDEDPKAALLALAVQPDDVKAAIRENGPMRVALRFVIGDAMWEEAERILAEPASLASASDDEQNSRTV